MYYKKQTVDFYLGVDYLHIPGTLTGATTPGQSEPGHNSNLEVTRFYNLPIRGLAAECRLSSNPGRYFFDKVNMLYIAFLKVMVLYSFSYFVMNSFLKIISLVYFSVKAIMLHQWSIFCSFFFRQTISSVAETVYPGSSIP